jgi:hypothetical protein
MRAYWAQDLAVDQAGVFMPHALDKKISERRQSVGLVLGVSTGDAFN